MGIIRAFHGALTGTFADQWKEIITSGNFSEHVAVAPGVVKSTNSGRGSNLYSSEGVLTNGSKIYVPENTAAYIINKGRIEAVIVSAGGYEYKNGEDTIFENKGVRYQDTIKSQVKNRFEFGGIPDQDIKIGFVNRREIRDIKFGTKGPLMYNDSYYGTDLEVLSYGTFSLQITDVVKFIKNYVPANVIYYSFDDPRARTQILSEFLQSFTVCLNSFSKECRISELPSKANEIAERIASDPQNAGSWEDRFGFKIIKVGIRNIEFSPESKELVRKYSANKMSIKAYDDISQTSSNIAAQQKIASGIEANGMGDGAGMVFGMNFANNMSPQAENTSTRESVMSFEEQIENVKKLKELLDAGILTQEEFDIKKKEIMNL